jgi:hypothetical protein
MTGTKITEFEFPDVLKEWKNVALACDKLSTEIYNLHGKYLFHSSETPNGWGGPHAKKLPLLNKNSKDGSFGLFDIVRYLSKTEFPDSYQGTDSQVNEHADPGLLYQLRIY